MEDQLLNFEILKAADATLWRQYQEEKYKWEQNNLCVNYPSIPTCDDLFKLGNEWKEFIKSNIKVNQLGVSTSST